MLLYHRICRHFYIIYNIMWRRGYQYWWFVQLEDCADMVKKSKNVRSGEYGVYVHADGMIDSTNKTWNSIRACILAGQLHV